MKTRSILGWALIPVMVVWPGVSRVGADGGYFSRRSVAVSADQRAILTLNGDQTSLTLSTAYTGNGEEFGWIIPVPVPPAIEDLREEADEGEQVFRVLDRHTAPQVTVTDRSRGCFPAGTEVLTVDGPRAIETLRPGTEVYAYDLQSGEWAPARVARQGAYEYQGEMITVQLGGFTIQATGNHPFCVLRGQGLASRPAPPEVPARERGLPSPARWVEARELVVGDVLKSRNAGDLVVTGLSRRTETREVYHLEVERYHNYAVHSAGILVHNGGKSEEGGPEESPEPLITVIGTVSLEHYEVSVLKAAEASALLQWLQENEYQVDPAAREVLDAYVDEKWAFVAVKLNPSERRAYREEFLPPLTIRYRHGGLVFPLRISSVSTARTARIVLYVVAESTVSCSNLPTSPLTYDPSITEGVNPEEYVEACVRNSASRAGAGALVVMWAERFIQRPGEVVRFGGELSTDEAQRLRASVDGIMKVPFSGTQVGYLTRLETLMDPGSMRSDVALALDREPRSFRVHLRAYEGYDAPVTSSDTRLRAASQTGEGQRVRELLAAGADVNSRDRDQRTALMLAVRSGHAQIMLLLLEAGADANVTPEYGETALMSAARLGDADAVRILLESGAEVDAMPANGENALMVAAAGGRREAARILLEAGAEPNASANSGGWTALMRAAGGARWFRRSEGSGDLALVRMLLAAGAKVNARDSRGETALMWAAEAGHTEIVRALVDAGADVNTRSAGGSTALTLAKKRGDAALIDLLVAAGAKE